MPSSRSAKEICREFGETDIACKVAKKREARRRRRREAEGITEAAPPKAEAPRQPLKPPRKETIGERRRRQIEEAVEGAQTGKPPS